MKSPMNFSASDQLSYLKLFFIQDIQYFASELSIHGTACSSAVAVAKTRPRTMLIFVVSVGASPWPLTQSVTVSATECTLPWKHRTLPVYSMTPVLSALLKMSFICIAWL